METIRKVLFIQSVPCIRTSKVAKALNNKGIQVDMLYMAVHPSQVYKDFKLPYKNIYQIKNINETIEFVNNSDYDILYSSNEPDYLTVLFLACNKPIVHDTHDMMSLRSDITNEEIVLEYIANVKSTGNIYVNPMIRDIAVERYNLKNKPILCLHSYIDEDQLPLKYYEKLSHKDGQIHCVFEGGLHGTEGHHRFLEPIFLKLAENHIHVHLHCPVDENYIKELIKKSEYIHYEGVTSPQDLICEMTKYDVGLAVFNLTERNKTFLDTAFPNKIWDYLAAGLPIMFADLISFRKFSEENDVGKVLNLDSDIKQQFQDVMNIRIDRNILKRKKWTMDEAADEIIEFLAKVKEKYYLHNDYSIEPHRYNGIIDSIRKTYDNFKAAAAEKVVLISNSEQFEKDEHLFASFAISGLCLLDKTEQFKDYKMVNFNNINTINYDYVIIDNSDGAMRDELKRKLISLRVSEDKIILWQNIVSGLSNIEGFSYKLNKYVRDGNFEVIITGLSYAESGISTDYLAKPAFNFALSGQDMYYDYKILKYIIDKKVNTSSLKYVVMNLAYYSFGYDLSKSNNKYRVHRYYNELKDTHNNPDIAEIRLLSEMYPKCENSLKYEAFCETLFNGVVDEKLCSSSIHEIKKQSNMMYPETIEENTDILKKILEMLNYNNIKAVIVILPVTKYYQKAYDYKQKDAFYNILNSLKSKYTFEVMDYFQNSGFEDDEFYDPSHFNLKGARKFTCLLNDDLNGKQSD